MSSWLQAQSIPEATELRYDHLAAAKGRYPFTLEDQYDLPDPLKASRLPEPEFYVVNVRAATLMRNERRNFLRPCFGFSGVVVYAPPKPVDHCECFPVGTAVFGFGRLEREGHARTLTLASESMLAAKPKGISFQRAAAMATGGHVAHEGFRLICDISNMKFPSARVRPAQRAECVDENCENDANPREKAARHFGFVDEGCDKDVSPRENGTAQPSGPRNEICDQEVSSYENETAQHNGPVNEPCDKITNPCENGNARWTGSAVIFHESTCRPEDFCFQSFAGSIEEILDSNSSNEPTLLEPLASEGSAVATAKTGEEVYVEDSSDLTQFDYEGVLILGGNTLIGQYAILMARSAGVPRIEATCGPENMHFLRDMLGVTVTDHTKMADVPASWKMKHFELVIDCLDDTTGLTLNKAWIYDPMGHPFHAKQHAAMIPLVKSLAASDLLALASGPKASPAGNAVPHMDRGQPVPAKFELSMVPNPFALHEVAEVMHKRLFQELQLDRPFFLVQFHFAAWDQLTFTPGLDMVILMFPDITESATQLYRDFSDHPDYQNQISYRKREMQEDMAVSCQEAPLVTIDGEQIIVDDDLLVEMEYLEWLEAKDSSSSTSETEQSSLSTTHSDHEPEATHTHQSKIVQGRAIKNLFFKAWAKIRRHKFFAHWQRASDLVGVAIL